MKLKLAIDASRNRSGGAVAHIVGLIKYAQPEKFNIHEIHIWTHKKLALQIPSRPWLVVHTPKELDRGLGHQLIWQYFKSAKEFKSAACDIALNTDAGCVGRFSPSVTMSRDMLSYEIGEMQRYGISKARLRLLILRSVQNSSLRRASGAIFLTEYASQTIQNFCGKLKFVKVIPHGVNEIFKNVGRIKSLWNNKETVRIIYVSNTAYYKHQWNVVRAIALLRSEGLNLSLSLVGGGSGGAEKKLESVIEATNSELWVKRYPFLEPEQVKEKLINSDIFLFASSCENMPNTLIEGMIARMPIACSNRGPMPQVLGNGGVYFNPEEPSSIASSIKSLICDNELRLEIAEIAYARAKQYSWARCADETLAYITETYIRTKNSDALL